MKSIGELERRSAWSGILKNPVLKPLAMSAGLVVIGLVAFMAVDAMGAGLSTPSAPSSTPPAAAEVAMGEKVAGATVKDHAPAAPAAIKSTAGRTPTARAKSDVSLTKDATPSLWRTGLALVGCMALLFGLAWWLKNYARDGRRAPLGDKLLKIRDVLNLGPKRQVFVLSVEGRTLVVGLADNRFTLLTEMSTDDVVAPQKTPDGGGRTATRSFEDELVELATSPTPAPAPSTVGVKTARAEACVASSDVPSPARLKLEAEAAKETTPPAEVATAFPFSRAQVDRVPPKFRHLLNGAEQGASA